MLTGNTVCHNTAGRANGDGGGMYLNSSDATLAANNIHLNSAGKEGSWGGGLFVFRSLATLAGNAVTSNTACYGGGIHLQAGSNAFLTNNVVAGNRANTVGSGLYIEGSSPQLLHTTIARNTGGDGSGIYITDLRGAHSGVAMTNTILVSHTVGITVTLGSAASLESTLWGTGAWGSMTDWGGAGTVITGVADASGDPVFVDADAGDYHIGPGSAAIDAGVDAGVRIDIDEEPRAHLAPDLGADEYWPPGAEQHLYLPAVFRAL
jgi:hypothetical protein